MVTKNKIIFFELFSLSSSLILYMAYSILPRNDSKLTQTNISVHYTTENMITPVARPDYKVYKIVHNSNVFNNYLTLGRETPDILSVFTFEFWQNLAN